ncbi:hypothetical protein FO519_008200 [Halicephalobus sp. NKZ332]|nr:hypothetical protein FO519_008200 [Halicephalobus sp. NKZ332]
MSEVLRCVVSFVDSTSESDVYTTILKIPSISSMETIDGETPPETEIDDRTTEKVVQIHNTEVEFYNELVSTFDLPHIKVFKALPWIIGESEGVLHMEDMTGKGDVMEFLCSLSISQILEIVRHLVHIHKVYLTSDDEYQELWREKHNKNYCTGTTFAGNIKNRELFLEICGDRDFFEPLLKKYYKFGSNPNYNTYSFYQSWKDLSLQPVLVHGDCHAGNIMWKLDEYGNLTDELVALFDWQMMYVGSPMADVGKLLATSVDGHIRRQLEEFIIEFYHDLLEKEMKETGQSSPYSTIFRIPVNPYATLTPTPNASRFIQYETKNVDYSHYANLYNAESIFGSDKEFEKGLSALYRQKYLVCEEIINDEDLMKDLNATKFDMGIGEIIEVCQEGLFELLNIQNVIHTSAPTIYSNIYEMYGIPEIPSFVPNILSPYSQFMNLKERLYNLYETWKFISVTHKMNNEVTDLYRKRYGPDFPHLADLRKKKANFIFMNIDKHLDFPSLTTSKIKYVGGLEDFRQNSISEHLQNIIEKYKGFVILSFGSVLKINCVPPGIRKEIISAFKKFPDYAFIWKLEKEEVDDWDFADGATNVYFESWIPQVTLLNHPKCKTFVSHAGCNSVQESILAGIPLIVVPLVGDQFHTAMVIREKKFGIVIEISDFHEPSLVKALEEMLNNSSSTYHITAKKFSERMIDEMKMMSPKDIILKHVEYAHKHGNLPDMELASKNLNFFQIYLLDVFILLGTIGLIGLGCSFGSIYLTYKLPALHNGFGYICAAHSVAEAGVLVVFILWSAPIILTDHSLAYSELGYRIGQAAYVVYFSCLYFLVVKSLNRFLAIISPVNSNKDIRFFVQACFTSLFYMIMIISFNVVARLVENKWLLFLSTTFVWELCHTMNGAMMFLFNLHLQKKFKVAPSKEIHRNVTQLSRAETPIT